MMKYNKECFEENGKAILNILKNEGFSNNQVIDFLPEAASSIASLNKDKNSSYVISNLLLEESSYLLSPKNISNIANNKGLSSSQVMSGFRLIAPFFLNSFLKSFSNSKMV